MSARTGRTQQAAISQVQTKGSDEVLKRVASQSHGPNELFGLALTSGEQIQTIVEGVA